MPSENLPFHGPYADAEKAPLILPGTCVKPLSCGCQRCHAENLAAKQSGSASVPRPETPLEARLMAGVDAGLVREPGGLPVHAQNNRTLVGQVVNRMPPEPAVLAPDPNPVLKQARITVSIGEGYISIRDAQENEIFIPPAMAIALSNKLRLIKDRSDLTQPGGGLTQSLDELRLLVGAYPQFAALVDAAAEHLQSSNTSIQRNLVEAPTLVEPEVDPFAEVLAENLGEFQANAYTVPTSTPTVPETEPTPPSSTPEETP